MIDKCSCGKLKTKISKHCQSCYIKSMIGKFHPNWKEGITKNNRCIDCGKSIKYLRKRCKKCHKNFMSNLFKGKNNPAYKQGKPHCKKCGKLLSTYKLKTYLCFKCMDHSGKKNPNYGKGEKIQGKKNVMWKGGISFFPYPLKFNNKLKKYIRNIDNFICQICHKKGNIVHHIDYNKLNCNKNNLITVCRKCHSKTNSNRDYWFAYFTYIMEMR